MTAVEVERPMLTTREVGESFGLSVKSVVGWVADGDLPAERVPNAGGRPALLRFDPGEVERFRVKREAAAEARRVETERRGVVVQERRQAWQERLGRRRAWSEVHREQIDRDGVVRSPEGLMARFPIEPLFAMCPGDPILRLSRTMGVNNGQIHYACRNGLTWSLADRWAVALGFHPCEVWGDAWWSLD